MSHKVSVLLLENVPEVGSAGEIVTVSEGYARNFLFPEGKAALATDALTKNKEQLDAKRQREHEARLAQVQQLAETLNVTEVTLTARVKDGDEIYGSIQAKHIAEELHNKAKLAVKPKDIELPVPLTRLGTTPVVIHLSPDVSATVHVTIVADPDSLPRDDEE